MSLLRFPEGMNSVWNNEAFDNGESEDSSPILKSSWSPSISSLGLNPSESVNYFSDKENKGLLENSSHSVVVKSPMPFKVLSPNGVLENSRIKTVSKLGFAEKSSCDWDEKKIDREMEDIEREINRLSLRLEALRIEKFEKSVKVAENRKMGGKISEEQKMMEEGSTVSARTTTRRRCLSLCPGDISVTKKRASLGPAEYLKSGQLGKKERMVTTPIQASQSRRKSCFWKLEDIGEEMVSRERGKKSLSLSPRSRKSTLRNQASSRQVATTIASKKTVKREDGIVSSIQPKKLFKDGEKSVATITKAPRPGRVVASRYNQNTAQASAMRKRSLPENDIDGSKQCDKKRSVLAGKSRVETKSAAATETRVKKRWEIPSELVVHTSSEADNDSPEAIVVPELLPRIKISRCINETPRDSGQAKRVVDLIGKKTYFTIDEEEDETSVCQALSFAEDEDEDN